MVDGFVLAGGASRRMGRDKARVLWEGTPLALHMVGRLRTVCARVCLVRHRPEEWPDLEVIADPPGDRHALRGVVASLEAARTPYALFVPVDVPRISIETLAALLSRRSERGIVVAGQPLIGVLPVALVGDLRRAMINGARVTETLAGCDQLTVPAEELMNLNAPEDLPDTGP